MVRSGDTKRTILSIYVSTKTRREYQQQHQSHNYHVAHMSSSFLGYALDNISHSPAVRAYSHLDAAANGHFMFHSEVLKRFRDVAVWVLPRPCRGGRNSAQAPFFGGFRRRRVLLCSRGSSRAYRASVANSCGHRLQ